jgi:hypothetical protein
MHSALALALTSLGLMSIGLISWWLYKRLVGKPLELPAE